MNDSRAFIWRGLSDFYKPYYDSLCETLGDRWQPLSGLRSIEEQAKLYAQGREIPGPNATQLHPLGDTITRAKAGLSFHNYGLATDWWPHIEGKIQFVDKNHPVWKEYIDSVEKVGLKLLDWERPHNQLVISCRIQDLFAEYTRNGMAGVNDLIGRILHGTPPIVS